MNISIQFNTGNDAFAVDFDGEIERILKESCDLIKSLHALTCATDFPIYDVNGNRVGTIMLRYDEFDHV